METSNTHSRGNDTHYTTGCRPTFRQDNGKGIIEFSDEVQREV